jgi:hypothetical protein
VFTGTDLAFCFYARSWTPSLQLCVLLWHSLQTNSEYKVPLMAMTFYFKNAETILFCVPNLKPSKSPKSIFKVTKNSNFFWWLKFQFLSSLSATEWKCCALHSGKWLFNGKFSESFAFREREKMDGPFQTRKSKAYYIRTVLTSTSKLLTAKMSTASPKCKQCMYVHTYY